MELARSGIVFKHDLVIVTHIFKWLGIIPSSASSMDDPDIVEIKVRIHGYFLLYLMIMSVIVIILDDLTTYVCYLLHIA